MCCAGQSFSRVATVRWVNYLVNNSRHCRAKCSLSSPLLICVLRRVPSVGLRREGEFHVLGFVSRDGDVGSLSAIGLMPGSDRVLSGGQVRQLKIAAVLAYVVVIRREHREVAVHPGMYVTFHRDEFWFVVLLGNGRCPGRLRFSPVAVHFGQRVNVMRGLVVVEDLKFLIDVHGQNVRNVLATFLFVGDCLCRDLTIVWCYGRNIHHHVVQRVVGTGDNCFGSHGCSMLLGAAGFLGHVDRFLSGRRAGVGHFAANGSSKHQARKGERHNQGHQHLLCTHWSNFLSILKSLTAAAKRFVVAGFSRRMIRRLLVRRTLKYSGTARSLQNLIIFT